MFRITSLLFVIPAALLAQSGDSQTLNAILQEIRQLRQDVTSMTLVAQRVQILLYRVQLQDNVVSKSAERHDMAKGSLEDAERNKAEVVGNIKQQEERLRNVQNPEERTQLENSIRELKGTLDMWTKEEQRFRNAEVDANNEYRSEEMKLTELQDRLNRMEVQLEAYPGSRAPK